MSGRRGWYAGLIAFNPRPLPAKRLIKDMSCYTTGQHVHLLVTYFHAFVIIIIIIIIIISRRRCYHYAAYLLHDAEL